MPHTRLLIIILTYALFASLWILFSDQLLMVLVKDRELLVALSMAKGFLFVALTTLLLYVLLLRFIPQTSGQLPPPRPLFLAWPRWSFYLLATVIAVLAVWLRGQIAVDFSHRPLLILMVLPILITAALGGFGPGLWTTVLVGLAAMWFMPPADSLMIEASYDIAQWGMLLTTGLLISLISETLLRARQEEYQRRLELERSQKALLESERRFKATFEQAAVGIAMVAPDGRWLQVNHKLCDITGYSMDELLHSSFQAITHPDDLLKDLEQVRRMLAREITTYSMEKRYIRKDGGIVWVLLTVALVWREDGEPDYFISVVEDISERKRVQEALDAALHEQQQARLALLNQMEDALAARAEAEKTASELALQQEALRQMLKRLDTVANASPAMFWTSGLDKRCDWFNRRWLEFTGRTLEQELGDGWLEGVHPEDRAGCMATYVTAFDARQPFSMEYRLRRADGVYRWLIDRGLPRFDADGQFIGYIGSCLDITEERELRENLRELNATLEAKVAQRTSELQALNQSLESFVYSVSHDLKAPLRGVEGYSRLLEEEHYDALNDEGRLFIQHIREGVSRMNKLIDDLLAYSRMERRALAQSAVSLPEVFKTLLAERELELGERGVVVTVEPPTTPVLADPDGLAVILRNLLDNALKFSAQAQPPRITIGGREEGNEVIVWVQDNGVGFDMKYHDRIFEIFQRLHRQEEYPGTGIGLALVKKAVQRMGGRIWAESAPGQGATFYLALPKGCP